MQEFNIRSLKKYGDIIGRNPIDTVISDGLSHCLQYTDTPKDTNEIKCAALISETTAAIRETLLLSIPTTALVELITDYIGDLQYCYMYQAVMIGYRWAYTNYIINGDKYSLIYVGDGDQYINPFDLMKPKWCILTYPHYVHKRITIPLTFWT